MYLRSLFLSTCLFAASLSAEIIKTDSIESILSYVEQDTLVLFNIAEVLTDVPGDLGSAPWRKSLKAVSGAEPHNLHDTLTWLVANKIQHQPPEPATPALIRDLQNRNIALAALTSRGRTEWYATQIDGVDEVTERMLLSIGIDLTRSPPSFVADCNDPLFHAHYKNGIFYANHVEKGVFLRALFEQTGYSPANVILVDDKLDSLKNVEEELEVLGIPFSGFWYTRTSKNHSDYSQQNADVELFELL